MTFVPGQTLTAAELNQLVPPSATLLGGTGTTFTIVNLGAGLAFGGGAISSNWQLGTVAAILGLAITGGTLEANWQGPTITAVGSGVSTSGGTLSASGSGGSVTNIVAGAGLNGGTITTSGTLTANYQAGTLTSFGTGLTLTGGALTPNYQAGVLSAFKSGLTIAGGTLAADWEGGVVNVLGLGIGLNSGTLAVKSQVTVSATNGATINIAPTGAQTNWMINGPAGGGTVHLTGSFTPGQTIVANVSNGATATNFILGAGFQFSTGLPSYTSTAVANERDILAFICNVGTIADVTAINQGFSP